MSETNTDEHVLLQNENNDQFKISNKSNKQIKTEKEDESLDINDQNILDYDDDDGNSTNNKMNLKEVNYFYKFLVFLISSKSLKII
jgi:hypothetical protein